MTTSSIRRQMKNIVNNYSEAEIKVREATSNDPWGPSSSLMTEIADLTYNVVAFSEIMSMVWKRLNDHGKNWRHVYKALTLLDYLIKTGSERVAQQCRENIFAIQTLKDFQYIDRDGKDQGINVREKSKQLVALLKDEERLKVERVQALKTKERMAQVATGVGSNQITFGRGSSQPNLSTSYSEQEYGKAGGSPASYHGSTSPRVSSELEQARPQTSGEEELQLQLALAMSREVAEQEERLRRGDDLRLQMALEESRRDTVKVPKKKEAKACCKPGSHSQQTTLLDLMDALPSSGPVTQKTEPWSAGASANQTNPWGGTVAPSNITDPWPSFGTKPAASVDPWGVPTTASTQSVPKNSDPWAASQQPASNAGKTTDAWGAAKPSSASGSFELFSNFNGTVKDDFSEFDNLRTSKKPAESGASVPPQDSRTTSPDLFESQSLTSASSKPSSARKTPESFLGPNAALVNLDSLVTKPAPPAQSLNPFLAPGAAAPAPVNPFQVNQPQPLTLNQLRGSPVLGSSASFGSGPGVETVAPMTSVAPHSSVGASGSSLTPLGPTAMNMVGSVGIPPSAAQSTGTTNPFLL
ncbi:epsin-2 isoform X4 [Mus musculus]|uniref:ENTH domain-containing protein n=3 Tax=Mus TaxID=862507 RepID=Q5NCM7_MOUSE|nr:epsin-2 isoform 3 [Mus musculus]XP_030101396.1 epsin-2 isoform X4 [Mus musculus]XP_030101397.1 epsin-2 isoform X4 [Mus musculus]XP_030101398.1 epsin-2 isoform X4 [Mus musculus]XP_030101399.1 epsin-2 isoform X4 [Mus musculus]XP_030101400.1 epsin-2 isoform X4 [Mus musculus]XP_030101401.1 epsin-2 isoform X4 [Mus musculus]XP_036012198.1 epsin-2 isoform X4 [Mus musculus]XP_036012199.1 epsin-2 isoform X4 [Mus musculus]XP_036012200.1 epsin-2 isoform X4 [Mus musculus]XP_036012201.1 epsin-2 iso|eukprot:NP_001239118.1 epsin-2 isoform 3 [Mus musculus]